jgi:hypothetical protein
MNHSHCFFFLEIIIGISKIGFRLKIKADSHFKPQASLEYVEDLKCESNEEIGLEDIFD